MRWAHCYTYWSRQDVHLVFSAHKDGQNAGQDSAQAEERRRQGRCCNFSAISKAWVA